MNSDRWTLETRELVASSIALHDLDGDLGCTAGDLAAHEDCAHSDDETCTAADVTAWEAHRADMVLAALASKGLLVQPGGETREEWASLDHGEIVPWEDEASARVNAAWLRETDPDARTMRRTVHEEPWRQASGSDENTPPTAPGTST